MAALDEAKKMLLQGIAVGAGDPPVLARELDDLQRQLRQGSQHNFLSLANVSQKLRGTSNLTLRTVAAIA